MIAKKKSKKADLEKKRFAFFQIGLIVSGAICLAAFEYTTIQFGEYATQDNQDEIFTLYNDEPPKEFVVKEKPQALKKLQIKIYEEVKEVVKKTVDSDPIKTNSDNIDIDDVPDFGEGDGTGEKIVEVIDDSLYIVPQKMPSFPGGEVAMRRWINNNIDLPDWAEQISGVVYVRFIVDKDGSVTNVVLSKGIHQDYDKASLAVVKKMPKWSPGEQAGKTVKVRYDLPIKFVSH